MELDERRRELESFAREQLAHGLVLFVGVVFGERGQEALQVAHVGFAERLPRPLGEELLEEARVPAKLPRQHQALAQQRGAFEAFGAAGSGSGSGRGCGSRRGQGARARGAAPARLRVGAVGSRGPGTLQRDGRLGADDIFDNLTVMFTHASQSN